jgi:release factor glutamine methyltransferase
MVGVASSTVARIWTIETVLGWATDDFRRRHMESPRLDAELLLVHALATSRVELIVDSKRPLTSEELGRFRTLVQRRRAHEPIAYIVGSREFYGRDFRVDRRVLIPRPDTETLVSVALARTQALSLSMRALDLCTGSGCVALTLARERPTALVVATDLSEDAISVARNNALRLGAYNVAFRVGNLFAALETAERFDLITANPPYIGSDELDDLPADVRDHEPRLALDGGEGGLVLLRTIVANAPTHLADGGVLAVEVAAGQAESVRTLFALAGFSDVEVSLDYGRIERVVSGVLRNT